ncbi:unnamed protein product [Ixodes pacificus]
MPGGTVKVIAYADDLTVLCSLRNQVQAVVQHIGAFCTASGAQMNAGKSKGAWLGEWDSKPEQFLDVSFADSVTNYLGVNLNPERLSTGRGEIDLNRLNVKVLEWQVGRCLCLLGLLYVMLFVLFFQPYGIRPKWVRVHKVRFAKCTVFLPPLCGNHCLSA